MGSTRNLNPVKSGSRELVMIAGSFAPAGTGAPTDVRGDGFTVARTGVGAFLLTFDKSYPSLIATLKGTQLSAADDVEVQFGDYVAASKTLVLRTFQSSSASAAAIDVAADPDNRVSFSVIFKNTAVS